MARARAEPEISPHLLVLQELAHGGFVSMVFPDGTEAIAHTVGEVILMAFQEARLHVDEEAVAAAVARGDLPGWLVQAWPEFYRNKFRVRVTPISPVEPGKKCRRAPRRP